LEDLRARFPERGQSFVTKVFWRAVTSPTVLHDNHLGADWYSMGQKTETINEKLNAYLGETAAPYSTVMSCCRKLKLDCDILGAADSERPLIRKHTMGSFFPVVAR
jgi:GH43 family beta-xylosidase